MSWKVCSNYFTLSSQCNTLNWFNPRIPMAFKSKRRKETRPFHLKNIGLLHVGYYSNAWYHILFFNTPKPWNSFQTCVVPFKFDSNLWVSGNILTPGSQKDDLLLKLNPLIYFLSVTTHTYIYIDCVVRLPIHYIIYVSQKCTLIRVP